MRVLVVGATGVVGRQLVPRLVADGHDVLAAARRQPTEVDGARAVPVDLLDARAARRLVREHRPNAIVHQATALAGLGNNLRRFDELFATTNRLRSEGTATLIAAAGDLDRPARLIVQSFCGWPWAPTGGPVKTEDDPLDARPAKAFRQTLRAITELERIVGKYGSGVVLRYGGLYGPGTSLSRGGSHIEAIRAGRFPLVGKAGAIWSFLHVGDAADAAVAALTRGRGVYNIVDDHPAPVSEWLPELARIVGGPPPRRVPVWLARLIGGRGLVHLMTTAGGSSNAKARAELDWRPAHPDWRTGIADDLSALR